MSKLKARILVIEDEEDVRRHLVRALRRQVEAVDEAADGEAALQAFRDEIYPVVLLDLRIPKLDGLNVLERIRELSPESQVIILSGHGGKDDVIKALNLHAFRYIEKPPNVADIASAVRAAYDAHVEMLGVPLPSGEDNLSPPTLDEVREAARRIRHSPDPD